MYHCQSLSNNTGQFILLIAFNAGSIYESSKNNGISHYLEHLMFKTKNTKSKSLMNALSNLGNFNGATTKDVTYYYIQTTSEKYKQAIDILFEVCLSLHVMPLEFEKEKKIVIEEMMLHMDSFPSSQTLMENMFCNTPYALSIIGTKGTIQQLTQSQVNEYYLQRYKNGLIVMNADRNVVSRARTYLQSKLKSHKQQSMHDMQPNVIDININRYTTFDCSKPIKIKIDKNGNMSRILAGFLSFPYSDPRFVITEFISFAMSHELFKEAREKHGITYHTKVTNTAYHYTGLIEIDMSTSSKDAYKLIDIMFDIVKGCKKPSWWTKAFNDYKKAFEAKIKQDATNPMFKVMYTMYSTMYGNASSVEDMLRLIRKIGIDEVCEVCNTLFVKERFGANIILHGDNVKSKGKLIKLIKNALTTM